MKKSILFLGLMLCVAAITNAQVSFFVDSPADITGGYETLAADPGTDWSVPDMSDPANVVVGEMCMGTDSLACEALTNGADLAGKIVVVYRGACEFGFKALQAQNEGAIACIIVNHSPGVVPMGGGADGINVTIPVIMVSNSTGAVIHDAVAACNGATATIGNLNGFFENNLRLTKGGVLRSSSYGQVAALNTNSDEFSIETGAWVYNFGQSEETAGVLNLDVNLDGGSIYSESSDELTLAVGDSVFVMLPTFTQESYAAGEYDMNYTVGADGVVDGFEADNISPALFELGNVFSYARLNENNQANPTNHTSPATVTGEQHFCIMFEDPNASEIAVTGFSISGTHFTETIADMDIEIAVYEWLDTDEGLGTGFESLNQLDSEGYTFNDGEDDALITIDFSAPIELDDDVRYAFCIVHENDGLQLGYDSNTDYTETVELSQRPIFPFWDDADSFPLLFGADLAPAISVNTTVIDGVEEISNEIDITPFPNPANEYVNIPFTTELRGNATINIMNLQGQLVSSQQVNVFTNQLRVDVSAVANGNYVFNVVFANDKQSTFNVVVNR